MISNFDTYITLAVKASYEDKCNNDSINNNRLYTLIKIIANIKYYLGESGKIDYTDIDYIHLRKIYKNQHPLQLFEDHMWIKLTGETHYSCI